MPEIDPIRLDFQEAIDYFSQKTNLDTDNYIEGQGIVQDAAFTVAAAKGQLLQDIRDAVALGQSQGQSVQEFLKTFDAIADRYSDNWELKGNRAWRGQLIYDQNLRNAYQAGRYAQMTQPDVMKLRPYWQWRHGGSRDPRPVHLAMDGKVFPADSLGVGLPWGFSCRCTVFSLSERDLKRKGLKSEDLSIGQDIDVVDAKGNTYTTKLLPDKGFEHTLGRSSAVRRKEVLENSIRKKEPDLQASVRSEAMPIRLREDRLQQRRQSIVNVVGERLVKKAEIAIQKALEKTKVYVQVYPDALEQIIADGRFKSAFELNEKNLDEVEIRRSAEQLMYGYPDNHPVTQRPISGFLATSSKLGEAPLIQVYAYGSIELGLKRTVKNKASFTLNDSLTSPTPEQRGQEISWQPSALLDVNIASLVSLRDASPESIRERVAQFSKVKNTSDIANIKADAYGYNYYMEVGVHGGLSAESIDTIIYRKSSPSNSIVQWAAANNVKIEVKNG